MENEHLHVPIQNIVLGIAQTETHVGVIRTRPSELNRIPLVPQLNQSRFN